MFYFWFLYIYFHSFALLWRLQFPKNNILKEMEVNYICIFTCLKRNSYLIFLIRMEFIITVRKYILWLGFALVLNSLIELFLGLNTHLTGCICIDSQVHICTHTCIWICFGNYIGNFAPLFHVSWENVNCFLHCPC